MTTPLLPQNDPNREAREQGLQEEAKSYVYAYDQFDGIAMAESVPVWERPGPVWAAKAGEKVLAILSNSGKVHKKFKEMQDHEEEESRWQKFKHFMTMDVKDIPAHVEAEREAVSEDDKKIKEVVDRIRSEGIGWVFQDMVTRVITGFVKGWPENVEGYDVLYQNIAKPPIAETYRDDGAFAQMRVAGPNPLMFARINKLPDHFPVTDAQFKQAMGEGDSLLAAAQEGRLFLADYSALDGAPGGDFPNGQKYLYAPLALFAVPGAGGTGRELLPVAIQLGQDPSQNPIFTPADGEAWLLAKSIMTTADGNLHQAVSHLGHTHLVLEAVTIPAKRCLAKSHPLRVLLDAHMEGTLSINQQADKLLCAERGGVECVLSGTLELSRGAAVQSVKDYDFNAMWLRNALAARGVDDADTLPEYPYRDDAVLLWDAIHEWIDAYTAIYYTSDADVVGDTELQAWGAEIVSEDGGRLKGFGDAGDGRIQTRDYLVNAVTHIIFTGSVQHAAVNFPQWEDMGYCPNYPLSAYQPQPTSIAEATSERYLKTLPPLDMALYQMEWGFLLGGVRHTKLGGYPNNMLRREFHDPRVKEPMKAFQHRLAEIEKLIEGRNLQRPRYDFLKPSLIPQSINI